MAVPAPKMRTTSVYAWVRTICCFSAGPEGTSVQLETLEYVQNQCWAAQPHSGATWPMGRLSVGLRRDLRSLPTKTTPWFCDFPAMLKLEAGTGPNSVTRANVTENTILHAALESGTRGGQIVGTLSSSHKLTSNFLSPACHSVMDKHPNLRQTWSKGALLPLMKTHCHWACFKNH